MGEYDKSTESQNFNDRAYQRALLLAMRAEFPRMMFNVPSEFDRDGQKFQFNLKYLQEHGLCEARLFPNVNGSTSWGGAKITARGIDFLADDGGLSAILGVVTIKLHADQVRDLLLARLEQAPIPPEQKSALKKALSSVSGMGLHEATSELVKSGVDHIPNIVDWIRPLVGM